MSQHVCRPWYFSRIHSLILLSGQIFDKSTAWIYNNSCEYRQILFFFRYWRSRCGSVGWCRLYEVVPQESLHFLLPGRLSSNTTLGHIIDTYSVEPDFYHKLIADILAYLKGQEVGWEPQQWVCGPCIVAFLKKGMLGCFVSGLTKGLYSALVYICIFDASWLSDKHAFNENCRCVKNCLFKNICLTVNGALTTLEMATTAPCKRSTRNTPINSTWVVPTSVRISLTLINSTELTGVASTCASPA